LDEAFEAEKLGEAEVVLDCGDVAVAVFGPLPEFARVDAVRAGVFPPLSGGLEWLLARPPRRNNFIKTASDNLKERLP
jgi:hypothetical protein